MAKKAKTVSVPDAAKTRRESVKRTVTRSARGSVQLARGRFVTPEDKSLDKLDQA